MLIRNQSNIPNMSSRAYSLVALFAFATISITMAHASSQTQISLTSFGNSEIDLAWNDGDRLVRAWTEFSNFNPNDGSFAVKIIQSETGKVVSDSTIQVITQSQNSAIDFNSFVMYMVNAEDICQNEEFDADTSAWNDCNPLTGQYEMQISTNDGSGVESTTFNIVDTRV
jgi:hypothetical protein